MTLTSPLLNTVIAKDKVLISIPAHDSAQVHLSHPNLSIKLSYLMRLYTPMRPSNDHHLPYRVLYHHLLISVRSTLIARGRYLSLVTDNTIHTLSPNGTHDPITRLYHLHLFLNPSNGSLYLQYAYEGGYHNNRPVSTQRLDLTTRLPVPSSLPRDHTDIA